MSDLSLPSFVQIDLVIQFVLILVVAYVAQRVIRQVLERVVRRAVRTASFATEADARQREDTLISVLYASAVVTIWIIAGLLALGTLEIDIGPLLAGAGVAGVALGFGAQSLVKDFLAGIFVLLENQYRVGDVVQINQGVAGVVQKVTLRMTELRDLEGKVHYVPNGNIAIATNMTMGYANVEVNLSVGYEADLDRVERIINEVGEEIYADDTWRGIALEAPRMLRVDQFADSAIIVKVVCRTAPIRQWEVRSEILKRIKKAFDAEGITIPFPQLTLHQAP